MSYGLMRFLIAQKEEPPARRAIEARRYVEVQVITYDDVLSSVSEPGRMSSFAEIDLSAEASGKIIQGDISLKKGSSFKKGDIQNIHYVLPEKSSHFTMVLYTILGKKLHVEELASGARTGIISMDQYESNIYLLEMNAGGKRSMLKVAYLK
jgi:hypothetical protein